MQYPIEVIGIPHCFLHWRFLYPKWKMGGGFHGDQSRAERSQEGPGKCVPGAPDPKPQGDALVFS